MSCATNSYGPTSSLYLRVFILVFARHRFQSVRRRLVMAAAVAFTVAVIALAYPLSVCLRLLHRNRHHFGHQRTPLFISPFVCCPMLVLVAVFVVAIVLVIIILLSIIVGRIIVAVTSVIIPTS